MNLFKMTSKSLKGFYCSDIYVVADTRTQAISRAVRAYDGWVKTQERNFGTDLRCDTLKGDPGYAEEAKGLRELFLAEVKRDLRFDSNTPFSHIKVVS